MSKILNQIKSMRFGLFMLGLTGVLSMVGSILPQGKGETYYASGFPTIVFFIIRTFKLYDIYNSFLFIAAFSLLSINLALCSISRFGLCLKRITGMQDIAMLSELKGHPGIGTGMSSNMLGKAFSYYGFKSFRTYPGTSGIYYARKHPEGYVGSWLIHTGILVVILFYAYGQMTFFTDEVYGAPGEEKLVRGTGVYARIRDFEVLYREDGSVSQYRTGIDIVNLEGQSQKSGIISVNSPFRYKGYSFYQTSSGWAADVEILKNGNIIGKRLCYEDTAYEVPEENIAIRLYRFYPDHVITETGIYTKSDRLLNPLAIYVLYYRGKPVRMDGAGLNEVIKWNEYQFFIRNAQQYTLLKVNKTNGKIGALIGSILIAAGLFIAFFLKPQEIAAKVENDQIIIYGNDHLRKAIEADDDVRKYGYDHEKQKEDINVR